jgi:N2227-like protein
MSLSLRFILSPDSTERVNQHRISPFSHWWSHQRSSSSTFREISFPDVLPRRVANWSIVEGDFLSFVEKKYDIIVALFFLDTGSNIISDVSRSERIFPTSLSLH